MRILFSAILLLGAASAAAGPDPQAITAQQQAQKLLAETQLIDGHNDWAHALRLAYGAKGTKTADLQQPAQSHRPDGGTLNGQTSIPWLRQGQIGGQLWSVYVPSSLPPEQAVRQGFEQIAIVRSIVARYPQTFALVTTAEQAETAWKQGRIASFLAMEGAHQVADDIATLHRAHAAGVRALTLAHSRPTALFDSATAPPRWHGMAPAGGEFIAEMNRLGMLVDLSHVSPEVMSDVLDVTAAPVIFSHSGAQAITDHPRNVPDSVLRRLPANGGLVMATFVPAFVDQARADWEQQRRAIAAGRLAQWDRTHPRPVSTLTMVADHIDHIARIAGHDHIGIGSDFDGVPDLPQGLENVAAMPQLFAELIRRGWTEANLRKLAGGNFLRVLKANEAVAKRLSRPRPGPEAPGGKPAPR